MSEFTTTLTVSPLADGKNWVLKESFPYGVGGKTSKDRIVVEAGFSTDFASIPRLLWFVLPKWGKYGNAAVVHDWVYWQQDRSRKDADEAMLEAMGVLGVPPWQMAAIYHSVRLFGWMAWKHNQRDRERGVNRVIADSANLPAEYEHHRSRLREATQRPPIHSTISLSSASHPDHYVRHGRDLCELTPVTDIDKKAATFVVRQGLAGGDSISFESVRFLGHFLRRQDFRIELQNGPQSPDDSSRFRRDVSFTARPGLSGSGTSFESVSLPGFYLRSRSPESPDEATSGFSMWLDDNKGGNDHCNPTPEEDYRKDASFEVVPGLHRYVDPERWYRLKTAFRGDGECLEGNHAPPDKDGDAPVKHGGAPYMDERRGPEAKSQLWCFEPHGLLFRLKTKSRPDECLEADFSRARQDRSGGQEHQPARGTAAFMDKVRDVPGQYWLLVPSSAGEPWFHLQTKFRGPGESLEGNQAGSPVKYGATFLDKTQPVSGQIWKFVEVQDEQPAERPPAEQQTASKQPPPGEQPPPREEQPSSEEQPPRELIHTSISLESLGLPDQYVRHRGGLGELSPVSSDLDPKDATFVIRQGLAGGASISFESVSHPGRVLRHQGYRIKLGAPDGSDLFEKDASFFARPGLCGSGTSFESVNFPGFYLRNCDSGIWIDNNQGNNGECEPAPEEAYRKHVSFNVVPGLHQYVDPGSWYQLKTRFRGDGECLEGNTADSSTKNGAAFMAQAQGASGQTWRFEPDGLFFRLKTQFRGDGECLEGNAAFSPGHGGAAFMDKVRPVWGQLWTLVPEGDSFRLQTKFRGPGESLEGNRADSPVKDGAAFLDRTQNVTGQLWRFEKQ